MIPGPTAFVLLTAWALVGALAVAFAELMTAWYGVSLAIAVAAWLDYRMARERRQPAVRRRLAGSMALGIWNEVSVRIDAPDARALRTRVFDHHPAGDDVEGLPASVVAPGGGYAEVRYRYRPRVRGDRTFEPVELWVESPFRLWRTRMYRGAARTVRVYPNFAEVSKYALLAHDDRLSQMGIRKRAQRGEGLEFHQLREYQAGDSLRQIDWKATSRMGKLISREYQLERDQQVMLLVDCGRRMLTRDGEFSHFDHSLNSALLLAQVALRQGDLVGLHTFGGDERRLAPGKGPRTLRTLLDNIYDLQPTLRSPDYLSVARDVLAMLRKRTLIVVITNLRDEDIEEIIPAVQLLQRRHLVLLASLRERAIGDVLNRPVTRFGDALLSAATHRYLLGRRRTHDTVRRHGVLTLDVEAQGLAVGVVNRYLDIKRSGVL